MLQATRCIVFPRDKAAVAAIENDVIDSRVAINVIELDYSTIGKLRAYGFFAYPEETGLHVVNNAILKVPSDALLLVIDAALASRKATNDPQLHTLIDRFVASARQSLKRHLPIWFNT